MFPASAVEMPKIWAAQWFSGYVDPDVPFDPEGRYLQTSLVDEMNRHTNLLALTRAQKAFDLDKLRRRAASDLRRMRQAKNSGETVSDAAIEEGETYVADLESRIDELRQLGGRDLDAESLED